SRRSSVLVQFEELLRTQDGGEGHRSPRPHAHPDSGTLRPRHHPVLTVAPPVTTSSTSAGSGSPPTSWTYQTPVFSAGVGSGPDGSSAAHAPKLRIASTSPIMRLDIVTPFSSVV